MFFISPSLNFDRKNEIPPLFLVLLLVLKEKEMGYL
jgi:hypothetical protein